MASREIIAKCGKVHKQCTRQMKAEDPNKFEKGWDRRLDVNQTSKFSDEAVQKHYILQKFSKEIYKNSKEAEDANRVKRRQL